MKIIVTGGRNYNDYDKLAKILSNFNINLIIQGGASGADSLAKEYAKQNNIPCETIWANWHTYGKSAGPKRNLEMLKKFPDALVVAFPGGKGTKDCVNKAISLGMSILIAK